MLEKQNTDCQTARPFRLENKVQNYAWGTRKKDAFIPALLGFEPEPDQAYAEMWMGIHPNAPSYIVDHERGLQPLANWLSEDPGRRLCQQTKGMQRTHLPYLLKVLSAGEALSIQAHPNKAQAEELHRLDAQHYPDDNHKPEIAIALNALDALVGFISDEQFTALLVKYPELKTLMVHDHAIPTIKEGMQRLFRIMEKGRKTTSNSIQLLQKRIILSGPSDETEQLFLDQYARRGAEDIGLLFIFLLNRVHLAAGEAVFLAPGVPHAYLKGNIIECMANSDNVVRLGLTEKFCDARALEDILVYDGHSDYRVTPSVQGHLTEYTVPVTEFIVKSLDLPEGESECVNAHSSLTMHILVEGELSLNWGDDNEACTCILKRGHSFITPANLHEYKFTARQNSKLFLVEIP